MLTLTQKYCYFGDRLVDYKSTDALGLPSLLWRPLLSIYMHSHRDEKIRR